MSVEVTKFAQTKTSAASSLKCQDSVDFFFDVDGSLYLQEIKIYQQFYLNVLQRLREGPRRKVPWDGRVGIGSCTVKMTQPTQPWVSSSFWLKTKWWLCPTTPTCPTSLLVTIFNTHGWSSTWKGGILWTLQRFNKNWWWPLTAFPLRILDNVSGNEGNAGIITASHRESILKETKFSNL
jgi:hypothetical protein